MTNFYRSRFESVACIIEDNDLKLCLILSQSSHLSLIRKTIFLAEEGIERCVLMIVNNIIILVLSTPLEGTQERRGFHSNRFPCLYLLLPYLAEGSEIFFCDISS
jgi:hypothetical protein